jgi:hypothetical protein
MPAVYSARLQQWALWILASAIVIGFAVDITYWLFRSSWAYEILGVRTSLGAPIVELNLDEGLSGDGYTFAQYIVSSEVAQEFVEGLRRNPSAFPQVPEYRRTWRCSNWKSTPMVPDDEPSAEFALDGPPTEVAHSVLERMRRSGGWYAQCVKRDDGTHISNSELFFLDLPRGLLTAAIVNT